MESYEYYIENINKLDALGLRTLNRYYLHPLNQRCCNQCKTIFTGVRENFRVKKYYNDKKLVAYEVSCKKCSNKRNIVYRSKMKSDYVLCIKDRVKAFRSRAKLLDVPFDLDANYLISLLDKQNFKCYYTGDDISFEYEVESRNRPHRLVASLDRLNPNLGYVKGNVAWTAYYINRMKNDLTEEEFKSFCKKVIGYTNE